MWVFWEVYITSLKIQVHISNSYGYVPPTFFYFGESGIY